MNHSSLKCVDGSGFSTGRLYPHYPCRRFVLEMAVCERQLLKLSHSGECANFLDVTYEAFNLHRCAFIPLSIERWNSWGFKGQRVR